MDGAVEDGGEQRRGRGRPAQLDADSILVAARELIGEEGTEALSMRGLARRLGVTPMSLYRHFPSKGALLVALLSVAYADEESPPDLPVDDRQALVELGMHIHEALGRHEWALDAVMTGEAYGRSAMWAMEEFLARVQALGGSTEESVQVYFACWRLVLGDLMQLRMRARLASGGTPWPRSVESFEEYPLLTAVLPDLERLGGAFDIRAALEALVAGTFPRE